MKFNKRDMQAQTEELLPEYNEAMITDLLFIIKHRLTDLEVEDVSIELFQEILDNWYIPEPYDWACDMAISKYESAQDDKYDLLMDK
jgi:hypothetical protein